MKLLIKFPTRSRPVKFLQVLDLYYENLYDLNNTEFLISCDTDDSSMNNRYIISKLQGYCNLSVEFLENKSKVQAINSGLKSKDFDLLLLASDDMIPIHKNFDLVIKREFNYQFPKGDGVLNYFDGFNKNLNTLPIMDKKYFDRFGYIYHPSYYSFWCDNEFQDVTRILNREVKLSSCIIKHDHPLNISKPKDKLYCINDSYGQIDKNNYKRRKLINFGLC